MEGRSRRGKRPPRVGRTPLDSLEEIAQLLKDREMLSDSFLLRNLRISPSISSDI